MSAKPVVHADPKAEVAVVAGVFMEPIALDLVQGLDPLDFYQRGVGCVYSAQVRLHGRGQPVDMLTVRAELERMGDLERAGGDERLLQLTEIVNVRAITTYANRVRELAQVRRVADACRKTLAELTGPVEDVPAFLGSASQSLSEAATDPSAEVSLKSLGEVMPLVEQDLRDRQVRHETGAVGTTTGLKALDNKLGAGFEPGWLVIVGGRPGMGKSAMAQCTARAVAAEGGPVLVFSLEMSRADWASRMAFAEASIDGLQARSGKLTEGDWMKFDAAKRRIAELPIRIDDTPGLSPAQLKARARRSKVSHGLSLVVVDYLQLMRCPHLGNKASQEQVVAEISRSLKELAKELQVPVLALAQLNRDVEKRGGTRRPQLSDLRNSGQIEQDADVISFVYRPAKYQPKNHDKRDAIIIVDKARHGGGGDVKCRFIEAFCRFEDFDPKTDQETGQRGWSADDYSDDKPWSAGA